MKQYFGQIYGGNNPTHGVYAENNLRHFGEKTVAIHHAWSEKEAQELASSETVLRGEKCVVVKYEIL